MNIESQIINLYKVIFNEAPNSNTTESLIHYYNQNNNSIGSVENYLRSSSIKKDK